MLAKATFPYEIPVKPNASHRIPPRIREKYLLYRIKQHAELLGSTNYKLLPVFQRQFARLNISPNDTKAREDKVRDWCNLMGHHIWDLGWDPYNGEGFWAPRLWDGLNGWFWRRVRRNREDEETRIQKGLRNFEYIGHDERF
jgi:hypothetical protein